MRMTVRCSCFLGVDTFGTFPSIRLIEGVRLIEVVKIAVAVTLYCDKVACC